MSSACFPPSTSSSSSSSTTQQPTRDGGGGRGMGGQRDVICASKHRRVTRPSHPGFSLRISCLARASAFTYRALTLRVFDCPPKLLRRLPPPLQERLNAMSVVIDEFEIPEEKIREAKIVFHKYDKRGQNKMSTNDLGPAFYALNLQVRDDMLKEWADLVDEDATGYIEESGFVTLYTKKLKDDADEKDLRDAFKILDKNKKGEIDVKDLRWILTSLGDDLSKDDVEEMIRDTDVDGSGFVDFEEFYKLMTG